MTHTPTIPLHEDASKFLVIVPMRLSDTLKNSLQEHVLKALQELPKEAQLVPEYKHCPDNAAQVKTEKAKQDGCTGDIYKIATIARDRHWQKFMVVDALSIRQITGTTADGETETVEAVVVSTDSPVQSESDNPQRDIRGIVARRDPLDEAVKWMCDVRNAEITPWTAVDAYRERLEGDHPAVTLLTSASHMSHDCGWILHDPKMPFFTTEQEAHEKEMQKTRAIDDALDLRPALPTELKVEISESAQDDEVPLEELTAAPKELDFSIEHMKIHCFEALPNDDLLELEREINQEIGSMGTETTSCTIYPWKSQIPGSRTDFWRLRTRIADWHHSWDFISLFPTIVLYPSLWKREKVLIVHPYEYGLFIGVKKSTLKEAVDLWREPVPEENPFRPKLNQVRDIICEKPHDLVELFIDPSKRFFPDFPPWLDCSTEGDFPTAPVFFLTSQLSDEKVKMIKAELYNADYYSEKDKIGFAFIPWEKEDDATVEDIWNMMNLVCDFEGGRTEKHEIICIDRQSAEDKTAIMVDRDWDFGDDYVWKFGRKSKEKELRGIQYGRTALSKAHIDWLGLEVGNASILEISRSADLYYYERPGYTGCLADRLPVFTSFPDDSEEDENHVEGETGSDENENEDEASNNTEDQHVGSDGEEID